MIEKYRVIFLILSFLFFNCNEKREFIKVYYSNITIQEFKNIDIIYAFGYDKIVIESPFKVKSTMYKYKIPFNHDDFYKYEYSNRLKGDTLFIHLKRINRNLFYLLFLREDPIEEINVKNLIIEYKTKRLISKFKVIFDIYPYQNY